MEMLVFVNKIDGRLVDDGYYSTYAQLEDMSEPGVYRSFTCDTKWKAVEFSVNLSSDLNIRSFYGSTSLRFDAESPRGVLRHELNAEDHVDHPGGLDVWVRTGMHDYNGAYDSEAGTGSQKCRASRAVRISDDVREQGHSIEFENGRTWGGEL